MDDDSICRYKNDPSWSEVIRIYSGLFETQNERNTFILDLAETNILLSAECKMTSLKEEDELENEIIRKAFYNFKYYDDYLSLYTLICMGEYLIVRDILVFKYKILVSETDIRYMLINREEPIQFIAKILNLIPQDLSFYLLEALENNIVRHSVSFYEPLISIGNLEQALNYYKQMRTEGIIPTAKILNTMILKDAVNAPYYCNEFILNLIPPNVNTLKAIFSLKGPKHHKLVNTLFNSIDFSYNSKKAFAKIYEKYINYQGDYSSSLNLYNKLLSEYQRRYNEELNVETHLNIIATFIEASEEYETAKEWFLLSHKKYGDKVNKRIYTNYLFKFNNDEINVFIANNFKKLIPNFNANKLNNKRKEEINSTISLFFSKLIKLPVTFESCQLLIEELRIVKDIPNYMTLKTIIGVFNNKNAIDYLIPIIITTVDYKPNIWASLIVKFDLPKAIDLFSIIKKYDQHKNIFIYNCIINKVNDYERSMKFIEEMTALCICPDNITYTTIIKQTRSFQEILILIKLCGNGNIPTDSLMEHVLYKQLLLFKSEFVQYFKNNSKTLYSSLNSQYYVLFDNICNNIIGLK